MWEYIVSIYMASSRRSVEEPEPSSNGWKRSRLRREIRKYSEDVLGQYSTVLGTLRLDRIEWTVSRRLYRAGGYCRTEFGDPTTHEIVVSYPAYKHWGWEQTQDIVRHELAHAAIFEEHGPDIAPHGTEFRTVAESIEAPIEGESPLPYRYELRCSACRDLVDRLYEPSTRTDHPNRYRSKCCDVPLDVDKKFPDFG